jgi:hypothetical protein
MVKENWSNGKELKIWLARFKKSQKRCTLRMLISGQPQTPQVGNPFVWKELSQKNQQAVRVRNTWEHGLARISNDGRKGSCDGCAFGIVFASERALAPPKLTYLSVLRQYLVIKRYKNRRNDRKIIWAVLSFGKILSVKARFCAAPSKAQRKFAPNFRQDEPKSVRKLANGQ